MLNFTQDVNTPLEDKSVFITADVFALRLNANGLLTLTNGKAGPQYEEFFYETHFALCI